ncbi:hypothetical protein M5G27_07225 [Pseudomonas shahriarae]|uniref:Uncharacterized protein n=1 Tax=Pseudomonas shahriarae TaxID=2745512 RepID=A0A9X4BZ83_9PSED|nr:hypothetical protein [Pseudomonas shahriarae]MDD1007271.1 hypothetical protein [Pseudomonas shahriarae]
MITTTLNLKGFDNLARRLKKLAATKVKVGFFEEDRYDDGMPVAQVAAYNEFGTRFHPERPFMRETLEDKQTRKKLLKGLMAAARATIHNTGNARRILATLGKIVAEEIKITIANYPGSNSARTIAAKGFDRPLYDTGKMLESVKFKFVA